MIIELVILCHYRPNITPSRQSVVLSINKVFICHNSEGWRRRRRRRRYGKRDEINGENDSAQEQQQQEHEEQQDDNDLDNLELDPILKKLKQLGEQNNQ